MGLAAWKKSGRTFRYRGHEIFFRREGSGESLLLIHGFPTASWDWHRLWPELTKQFDVIAADMIGFGFSDKPRAHDYSIMDQATLLESLLAELGVSSFHLFAHDYGDTVGQELLARQNDQGKPMIRSACFLNGGLFPGIHRPLLIQRLLMSPIGGLLVHVLSIGSLRRSFRKIFGPMTQPTEPEIADFWELIAYNDGRKIFHKLIRYMAERELHRARWVGSLTGTSVPLLHINGLMDPISGAHVARHFEEQVPQARIVGLERIGHYPQIEAPQEVLAAFLSGL